MIPFLLSQGFFKVRPLYLIALLLHIVALELGAWVVLWVWGNSWITWLLGAVLLCASQVGWCYCGIMLLTIQSLLCQAQALAGYRL